jgi:serine/threonine protein kinase/WD40 repeat protein
MKTNDSGNPQSKIQNPKSSSPSLAEFLAHLAERDPRTWADALREDQCRRWRAGETITVEDYLAELPTLQEHTDALLDIVYGEVLLRESAGEHPRLTELQARFPQHGEALARQWEVHQVLESTSFRVPCAEEAGRDLADTTQEGIVKDLVFSSLPEQDGIPDIAGYDILQELGRGGNGVVYLARQRSLNRLVAIKMIDQGRTLSAQQVARIRSEAELIARLQHPHIVAIHRVGLCEGRPFLVLEYVPGGSLAERMKGKPWPADEAAALVETLARTLAVLHEQGIVHRDLKPGNVLLATASAVGNALRGVPRGGGNNSPVGNALRGVPPARVLPEQNSCSGTPRRAFPTDAVPKLVDFGLAKTLEEAEPASAQALTATGELVGTPLYMAPEQAQGRKDRIGPATDQYALGVILYELLTGQTPFKGATTFDLLAEIVFTAPPPPSKLNRAISKDYDAIVLRCLAKQPAQRYRSALELAEDLHRVRHGFPSQARTVGTLERLRLWSRRQPVVAGSFLAVLVLLVATLAAVTLQWQRAEAARAEAADARAQAEAALLESERAGQAEAGARRTIEEQQVHLGRAFTESQVLLARSLIRLAEGERTQHNFARAEEHLDACPPAARAWEWHYLSRLCRMRLLTLPRPRESVGAVAISPAGRWLASASRDPLWEGVGASRLRVWDAVTGKPVRVFEGRNACAIRADGLLATVHPGGGVLLYSLKETPAKTPSPIAGGKTPYRGVCWSPDGQYLAAWREDAVHVYLIDNKGKPSDRSGPVKPPLSWVPGAVRGVAFHPDSKVLAVASRGQVRFWDCRTSTFLDEPAKQQKTTQPGKQRIVHTAKSTLTALVYVEGGKRIVTGASDGLLRVYDAGGGGEPVFMLAGHASTVDGLSCGGPDGLLLASVDDGSARVWDLAKRQEIARLPGYRCVALDGPGKRLLTVLADRRLGVWSAHPPTPAAPAKPHAQAARAMAFAPADGALAMASEGKVHFHDPKTLRPIGEPLAAGAEVLSLDFHPAGRSLAMGLGSAGLTLHDTKTGRRTNLIDPPGKGEAVVAVRFSRDGRLLAGGLTNGGLRLWRAENPESAWKPLWTLRGHSNLVIGLAFSPDSKQIASTGRDGKVMLHDVKTGKRLYSSLVRRGVSLRKDAGGTPPFAVTGALDFSPDGKQIATPSRHGAVVLLNAGSGEEEGLLLGHTGGVVSVRYSPDGRRLATGGNDGAVRLWDPARRAEVLALPGHQRGLMCLAFSRDGRFLAASARDRTVVVHAGGSGMTASP